MLVTLAAMPFPGKVPRNRMDMGGEVFLDKLPTEIKKDELTLSQLNLLARQDLGRDGRVILQCEETEFKAGVRRVQQCALCLWIAKPSIASPRLYAQGELTVTGWKCIQAWDTPLYQVGPVKGTLDAADLERAKDLHIAILGLPVKGSGPIGAAIKFLSHALPSNTWEIRYLLHWISLEALFGESPSVTRSLCVRIPAFLCADFEEGKKMVHRLKQGYDFRSQIVHGDPVIKDGGAVLSAAESTDRMREIERLIREALKKILGSQSTSECFCRKVPREYLNALPLYSPLLEYYKRTFKSPSPDRGHS